MLRMSFMVMESRKQRMVGAREEDETTQEMRERMEAGGRQKERERGRAREREREREKRFLGRFLRCFCAESVCETRVQLRYPNGVQKLAT